MDDEQFLEAVGFETHQSDKEKAPAKASGSRKGKGDKGKAPSKADGASRRVWTAKEEEFLLDALLDMKVNNNFYTTKGGFKSGYMVEVEKRMVRALSGTNIRARPHIESKLKDMRTNHGTAQTLLRLTGYTWNDEEKMIVVPKEDIDDLRARVDDNIKYVANKPLVHLEKWTEIWGKDRATGENAEGPADVGDLPMPRASENMDPDMAESAPSRTTSRKRSRDTEDDMFATIGSELKGIATGTRDVVGAITAIANRIGSEVDARERRGIINKELEKLNLSRAERLKVGMIIIDKRELVDMFLSLNDDEDRLEFIKILLKDDE